MTHELEHLIETARTWQAEGAQLVLATVVALEGSSYRRPGVRMLLARDGRMAGAISGGCVEQEVYRRALPVFAEGKPRMMTYDGRFRLGCEGTLYVLLEPLFVSEEVYSALQQCFAQRIAFDSISHFSYDLGETQGLGTQFYVGGKQYALSPAKALKPLPTFRQNYPPLFQLYLFGAEHDAVELSKMAHQLGWRVHIIAPPDEQKHLDHFTGAASLSTPFYSAVDTSGIDERTAVVLMTHSLSKDVQYLLALRDVRPAYFGLLGPTRRRERLFHEVLERDPDIDPAFFEQMHGPAGLDLGAESAAEIAVAILGEILSVVRRRTVQPLREKRGRIHEGENEDRTVLNSKKLSE